MTTGRLCCSMNGFSLHAATAINTHNRKGLERLISCIARGPFSNERLELVEDRKVKLSLKRAYADGTTHILLTYREFIEKLVALIPTPRSHLVRWSGSFAPNCKYRKKIVLNPDEKKGFHFEGEDHEHRVKNDKWAELPARVFGIDVLKCDCGGVYRPIAAVKDPVQVSRYLFHIGLPHKPPSRAPPRRLGLEMDFDQEICDDDLPVIFVD